MFFVQLEIYSNATKKIAGKHVGDCVFGIQPVKWLKNTDE